MTREIAPFSGRYFPDFFRRLDSIFRNYFDDFFESGERYRVPVTSIREEDDKYMERFEVPGIDKKDIVVSAVNGGLEVKAETNEESENGSHVSRFYSRLGLPEAINIDGITSSYKNGVLEVYLPKKEQVRSRKIEVK